MLTINLKINFLSLYLIVTIFSGCKEGSKKIRIDFANAKYGLFDYRVSNKDTILDGNAEYFYANNNIEDKLILKNGKKEGWAFHYDSLGHFISKTLFKDNLEDSIAYYYSKSGDIDYEIIYEKGIAYLQLWKNSPDKSFIYNAVTDTVVYYSAQFDSLGKNIISKGIVIAPIIKYNFPKDSIFTNKKIVLNIPYACIPGYKIVFDAGLRNFNSNTFIDLANKVSIKKYYGTIEYTFTEKGRFQIIIIGALYNAKNIFIRSDTLIDNIFCK
jgi:antitoxin component YwqK of YwqJK toxin-antitoxin module